LNAGEQSVRSKSVVTHFPIESPRLTREADKLNVGSRSPNYVLSAGFPE